MRKRIDKVIQLNVSRKEIPHLYFSRLAEELGIPWEISIKIHHIQIEILPDGPAWIACFNRDGDQIEF